MRALTLALLTLSVAAAPVAAQNSAETSAPKTVAPRPVAGPMKPYVLPAVERFTLANGLAVTLIPGGTTPTTTLSLRFPAGNHDEGDQPWIADIVSSLLTEGAGDLSGERIADAAAAMGARLEARTSVVETTMNVTVLSDAAPDALDLLATTAFEPTLSAEAFERTRRNFQRTLESQRGQANFQAEAALMAGFYGPNHAYGRVFPTADRLAAYTVEDARAFHTARYGARGARLYVAGRFDAATVRRAIETAFGERTGGPAPERASAQPNPGLRVRLVDRPGASQTALRLIYPAPSPSDAADMPMRAANALLAGSASSRILRNIRSDKGWAYSVRSHLAWRDPQEANWVFATEVQADRSGDAVAEVLAEIDRLRRENPSPEETAQVRTLLGGQFVIQNTTPQGLLDSLAQADRLGLPSHWIDAYVPGIEGVTGETVRDAAARHLDPAGATLAVVGDLSKVRPQLEALPSLKGAVFEVVAF